MSCAALVETAYTGAFPCLGLSRGAALSNNVCCRVLTFAFEGREIFFKMLNGSKQELATIGQVTLNLVAAGKVVVYNRAVG